MWNVFNLKVTTQSHASVLSVLLYQSKNVQFSSSPPTLKVRNKPHLHNSWGDVEIKLNRNQEVCILVQVGNILSDLAHNLVVDGHSELETEYLEKEQALISRL